MSEVLTPVLDPNGVEIKPLSVVKIDGDETSFHECEGRVMSVTSDLDPEDGPIAVFFGKQVKDWKFSNYFEVQKWDGSEPSPENYEDCPRVVCFPPEEVVVINEFSLEVRAEQLFPNYFHSVSSPNFPFKANSHLCFMEDCISDLMATERSLVNVWGTVLEVYTCNQCHSRINGMCTESIQLKDPLPRPPQ